MKKQLIKITGIIFMSFLLLFWVLGVLRFQYEWANWLFSILLFPFGFIYWGYESYCISNLAPSNIWNNEFMQSIIFIAAIAGQTALYYAGYIWYQKRRISKSLYQESEGF
ncbi:MAG: hypothetical protein RR555_03745 [Bacteroidales bacterium]